MNPDSHSARRHNTPARLSPALWLLPLAFLGACASAPPVLPAPTEAAAATQWHAPLPHHGQPAELVGWWKQFNDPLLVELQDAAQAISPTLAAAQSRVAQARAARTQASAALLPNVNAVASASRGRADTSLPVSTTYAGGLQSSWELDLFGGGRDGLRAAQARLEGANANWHAARVAVAAETASAYLALRACEAQLAQTRLDADSRAESARLTELSAKAGFQPPASAALARASAAQANSQRLALQAQCDLQVKGLVALTGLDEPGLRSRLAAGTAQLPRPPGLAVHSVPGEVLNQRPDLFIAARDVVAASAEVSQAQAARLPRIGLNGSIGAMRVETSMATLDGTTWSVGPLSLSLPLFDGGARRAQADAAQARYDEAATVYRARVLGAVREVEEALIQLQSAEAQEADLRLAVDGFDASFRAVESRYKGGLASLFELEDGRRSAVQAQAALIELQRARAAAWISLYRALGGGWTPQQPDAAQPAATPSSP